VNTTGKEASLTRGVRRLHEPVIPFALITVAAPARDTRHKRLWPCSSGNHSALRDGQGFHL